MNAGLPAGECGIVTKSPRVDVVRLDTWLIAYCRHERTYFVPTREAQRLGPVRDKERLATVLRALVDANRARLVPDGRRRLIAINPALVAL